MPTFTINYQFESEQRAFAIELDEPDLTRAEAILHLIELHHGDAENSLLMPDAQASEAQIVEQAHVLGITEVSVTAVEA